MNFATQLQADLEARPLKVSAMEHGLQLVMNTSESMPLIAEFGVFSGTSLRIIKSSVPHAIVCGFDSFRGLPEDWRAEYPKGAFSSNNAIPPIDDGVVIWKGMFDETLPQFKALLGKKKIDLIHIDCDLYTSTKTVFDTLHENIRDGTVLVFDELLNYPGYENHELRALDEFVQCHHPHKKMIPIGMEVGKEQAVIQIV